MCIYVVHACMCRRLSAGIVQVIGIMVRCSACACARSTVFAEFQQRVMVKICREEVDRSNEAHRTSWVRSWRMQCMHSQYCLSLRKTYSLHAVALILCLLENI